MNSLRSAYFPKFKGGGTLLLWGNNIAMHQLGNILREASSNPASIKLSHFCEPVDGKEIFLKMTKISSGMMATAGAYEWRLDLETMLGFADKVEFLANAEQGHQYLECGAAGEIRVTVACNEYPPVMLTVRDPAPTGKWA